MVDEASQDNCYQVVFLVDSNPSFWGSSYSAENAANAIRLFALRVLVYFSDYRKGKRSNIRWGYKIFTSRSLSHHVERHDFKEFSISVFEDFENQVSKKLNESFAQNAQDGSALPVLTKPPAGAKCICCAFTNAVHDFQWDGPDISSPVRTTRGNVNSLCSSRKKRNVMFLLSGCPRDDASIQDFGGEISSALTSLESLKNVLMPSVLYKEFKERQICLQWVNIGNVQPEENPSLKPLLEAFVQEFGGCVIPLSSVGCGSIIQDVSSSAQTNSSSFDGLLLPFKTAMDFYIAGKTATLSEVSDIVPHPLDMKLHCSETRGLLCSSGADSKVHCFVQLTSVFQPAVRQLSQISTEVDDMPSNVSSGPKTTQMPFCPTLLWIRGLISHSHVCLSWLHPMKAYSCIGLDCRQKDNSSNSALCFKEFLSGWFQELLLSLAKENKSLVVDFIDCESGLPMSGVLQPLTSICGLISVISSDFILPFEKLLFWDVKMGMLYRQNVRNAESSHCLVSGLKCKPASEPAEQPAYTEVLIRLLGSQNYLKEANDVRQFRPGVVDLWHPLPSSDDKDRLLQSELRGKECDSQDDDDVDDDDSEAILMRELKTLYNSKNMKSTSVVLKGNKSPQHEKDKVVTPKKSKWKNDSKKMSANEVKETKKDNQDVKLNQHKNKPLVEMNVVDRCGTTENNQMTFNNGTQEVPHEIADEVQLAMVICSICDKVIFEVSTISGGDFSSQLHNTDMGANIPTKITNIMMAVSKFYQIDGNKREKDCAVKFLKENVLLTVLKLREKYEGCDAAGRKEQQVREYQLQILLRTEIAALTNADENSSLVEEVRKDLWPRKFLVHNTDFSTELETPYHKVTVLLRAISFMKDPNFLAVYLCEVLLDRYSYSLSKFLCGVYEGLMMRPPKELLTPSKWSSDDESPVRRSITSTSISTQVSTQPRNSGCRVLIHHLSANDVGTKRREIVVPGKAKPKESDKKKKDKPQGSISAGALNRKEGKNVRGHKTPVKLVRRNLFMGTEPTDKNNSTVKVPKEMKLPEEGKKSQGSRRFHRRNTVGSLSKTAVQETPAHKQVSHALWSKQDRARKRSRAYTEVHVLEESPLKEIQAGENRPCKSPGRGPGEKLQRSQSFYGYPASVRPLTRARSFTGVRTRSAPKKEPREATSSFLETRAPQKLSVGGVSPLRFSPRDKKKFSLRSLLNTTKECNQREEILLEHQKPTTPTRHMATRSSPRLLKKSSFSCVRGLSVPSSVVQQKESNPLYAEHVSMCPDGASAQGSMKTPKKEITEMGRCVLLVSPIRNPLKSPLHVSQMVADNTLLCSQPRGTESTDPLKYLCANDEAIATSLDNVTNPAIRSSPRLLRKRKISENVNEALGECLFEPIETKITDALAVISPNLPHSNSAGPKTPIRDHLNECVVCLTPMRQPIISPMHIRPRHIKKSVSVDVTKVGVTSNVTNVEISPTLESSKTPRVSSSPPQKGKKRYRGPCSSPAETKRLSPLNQILRQQKQKRCLSGSPADKWLREDILLDVRDTPAKHTKKENSTGREDANELSLFNVSCRVVVQDNNSRTSADVDDWLTEMQKEFDVSGADESQAALSPPTKKRRIHKSVVFGGKQARKGEKSKEENSSYSLSRDTSFEEDDEVFHSPAVTVSSLKQRRVNKTPLSASSIKVLEESPILCDDNLKVSPLLCTGNCSDPCQKGTLEHIQ